MIITISLAENDDSKACDGNLKTGHPLIRNGVK